VPDNQCMSPRSAVAVLACAVTLAGPAALLAPAPAGAHSIGTPGQIAWVRSAATRFVSADACGILNAPLRTTEHGRTCTQRWNAKLAQLLREPGVRAQLRAQKRAIGSGTVIVHGNDATIALPTPLMNGRSSFVWTENCWMVVG